MADICKTAVFEGTVFERQIRYKETLNREVCVPKKDGEPQAETDKRFEARAREMAKQGFGGMWSPRFERFLATAQEASKTKIPETETPNPGPKDALEKRYPNVGRDRL